MIFVPPPGIVPPEVIIPAAPEVHISYGQSWRSNSFPSFDGFSLNPQHETLLTPHVARMLPNTTPGPLSTGAGINPNLPPEIDGITGFASSDNFTIGRCAILAQQLLRVRAGETNLVPIIEFCCAYPGSSWATGGGGGLRPGAIFVGSISGTTLTVTSVSYGTIWGGGATSGSGAGQNLTGSGVTAGTKIVNQISGDGLTGTYEVFPSQAVPSTTMTSRGVSWDAMVAVITKLQSILPNSRYLDCVFKSVGYTQGGSHLNTVAGKEADLQNMMSEFDSLGIGALNFYLGIAAAVSNDMVMLADESIMGTQSFCKTNANGRTWATTPWYQWPFDGISNIHTNDYGTIRHGEIEGYAKYVVEDEVGGGSYTPLWRSGSAITRSGQNIIIPWSRPSGNDFASGVLAWQSDANDGIKIWPQYGFHVLRSGIELTVSPIISGLNVVLGISETLSPGDNLEVSYAMRGPGGPNPGTCSGIGGNLMMAGPDSVLFSGKKINAWAWPFMETIVA